MIRAYQPGDADRVLALNEQCVPEVGSVDRAALGQLAEWAAQVVVVDVDGAIIGLLIGLVEQTPYQSPNYAWFSQRHESFAYIDRVAIDERNRGAGWGPALYRHFEAWAVDAGKPILCAEVNTEPPNPRSLRFHDLFGFTMVAQTRPTGSDDHRVGMMEKPLRGTLRGTS
jgi:predicted GNAT superfamily acetyltransferase